ncbi:MAG: hypothetical protein IIV80_05920 [Clostridia bacterium]|nr:hypothetical protein [Clostridia bacterium]
MLNSLDRTAEERREERAHLVDENSRTPRKRRLKRGRSARHRRDVRAQQQLSRPA